VCPILYIYVQYIRSSASLKMAFQPYSYKMTQQRVGELQFVSLEADPRLLDAPDVVAVLPDGAVEGADGKRTLEHAHALVPLLAGERQAGHAGLVVGVNFLIAGYAFTRGGLAFDTSLPLANPELKTSRAVLAYARALDLWGTSEKSDLIVPYSWLSGSADHAGQPPERVANRFADPSFRVSGSSFLPEL
jgi:hypothetical protein